MLERPSKLVSYRFDQLADQINKRVMPDEADVERYVGLEHLDPDSLRIRRWGDTSEVESTKLLFQPGDIIFGKRRVYQRKVAVADFKGICSAHAMVLRAKPETVLPEFLPFFMQSDLFMERALSISVGSLSPTINWKALAKEEFLLPPIQEQARLVEAAKSMSNVVEAHFELIETSRVLKRSLVLGGDNNTSSKEQIGKLCRIQNGFAFKSRDFVETGTPLLTIKAIRSGSIAFDEATSHLPRSYEEEYNNFVVTDGDILLALSGATTGKSGLYNLGTPSLLNQRVARFVDIRTTKVTPVFFRCLLEGLEQRLLSLAPGSAQPNISTKDVSAIEVPLPALETQREISKAVLALEDGIAKSKARFEAANSLKDRILKEAGIV